MNKEEFANRIQEGFFDLAPDMFDEILEAIEQPDDTVINISDKKKERTFYKTMEYRVLSRVAVFALVIGLGFGFFGLQWNREEYVVTLDVNPSIQMELNKEYNVRSLQGLNEDGKQLVDELVWKKNSSVEQTLDVLTDSLVSGGYLKEEGGILVTMYQNDKVTDCEELKIKINQELEQDAQRYGVNGVVVAFQTVQGKVEQTGKEVLKEKMIKNYDLDDKDVDAMNIRTMIDYIEEENDDVIIIEEGKKLTEEQNGGSDSVEEEATAGERVNNDKEQPASNPYDENSSNEQNENKEYPNGNNIKNNKTDNTKQENVKSTTEKEKTDSNSKDNKKDKPKENEKNSESASEDSNKPDTDNKEPANGKENNQEKPTEERNNENGQEKPTEERNTENGNRQEPHTGVTDGRNPDVQEQSTEEKNQMNSDGQPNNPANGQPNNPADGQPNNPVEGQPNNPADGQPNNPADRQPNNQPNGRLNSTESGNQ